MDKPSILVAEDEGIIAKDLENTLKGMGYAVSGTASSGQEAIRKALETRPDLVLMDVVLRGNMDGVAAAEEVRARLGIPVIFLTAYADEKTLQRAKISGPFGYMLKPFEERELRGAIEVALNRHEMEKKLKKSAEEWRSTFDSIQDWVSIHDCNFRIVRVNRAMADAFRRAPQDMIGKTCYQVFHGSNEPIPQCPHRRALETRRPAREEFFDPGLGIYLEISTSPVIDEKGELTGTVHIAKDISERKKAEEDLHKSEEGARRLARENMIMAEIGRIVSSSPRIEEIYDRFAEKVRTLVSFDRLAVNLINGGKSFSIPYVAGQEIEGRRSGEKIPLAGTATEEVARTRSSLFLRKKDEAEILERFPGFRPVFEAGLREMILVPMIASGGCMGVLNLQSFREGTYGRREVEIAEKVADQIAGAVGNAWLHRQTIEAQGALRESEERYRRLFEGIPIGLYRSTPGGKLLDANPAMARLFGYPDAASLRREDMADTYVDPRDRERFKSLMDEKGGVEQFRVERWRRDGSRFWVETHSLAVRGPDGAIQYLEGSVQDASDRQAFEEELRRSENHARRLALEKTILAEIGRIISSTTDIEEVYKSFAWEVKKLLPFDRLIVTLVGPGKATMINRFVDGISVPGKNAAEVFPLKGTFGEEVIESRRGILLRVENEEEAVTRFPGLLLEIRAGLKSALSVPLFYRHEAVGVLHIFSRTDKAYREEDLPTARSIADQIAGAVINAQLFNELKNASQSLAESEERYRAIMESASRAGEGVIILQDLGGKKAACIFANEQAAKITEYTKEELLQTSWMEIVHPLSLPSVRDRYRRRMSGEDMPGTYEISFRQKSGREVPVEIIASQAQIEGKAALIAFFRDITARKELERQLAQAQRLEAVGQLAAGIAHEINTPTQYVGDNARFLQESFRDLMEVLAKYGRLLEAVKSGEDGLQAAGEVEEAVRKVDLPYLTEEIPRAISQSLEGVDRVTKIVRAMKEFSHPGAKEKSMADINKAIENTITISRNEWKYVAEMVTDLNPSLPPVPCLLGEFNQVILNIIVNAAHAIADVVGDGSGARGTIRVATRREKDWVEARISDTGAGIPESIRSKIFDPFFTTKTVGKGTGQGLTIAHSVVVEKHGGTIHFETETGKGTTFIIRLPIAPKEKEQGSEE